MGVWWECREKLDGLDEYLIDINCGMNINNDIEQIIYWQNVGEMGDNG